MKTIRLNVLTSKLNSTLIAMVMLAAPMVACSSTDDKLFDNTQTLTLFNDLVNREAQASRRVELAPGLSFPVILEGTSRGNGTLKIHNLHLRVFDEHDDGVVYENRHLAIDFQDLNGDNIKELVISGVVKYTGETETDPVSYENIIHIYTFNCKTGLFSKLYKAGNYSPELSADAVKPRPCE